ncbi:hypothetical protein [Novosphingobium sp.]|jgi:hypothetical protein|uniref:CC_3452 family protein n=1 Tax=Novosphingobium sp. TaxID=1874826 RepID=UPI0022C6B266|nr:hypothetical protein [Novosphingobium sp.]MCZ8324615.1 hypothetical protein [Sphingomonadaceae bacterium]MCZ8018263.1 hypothetical protein [Novosphingobium sp.]MCZ8033257.1 hypothetical protein [Novosphingobium sp.]MCZ8051712.1 hypothetical protein [Novosphingobium sp.]MCZ8060254.1 hypothetical protein [Novosphingobium sp.]
MLTATANPLSRTLLAAGLALVGTVTSFAATTNTAHAQSAARVYTATLATAVEAPARKVVNGVQWSCTGTECTGRVDGAAPINTCARVAKAFGQVTKFATPKGEFDADKLARCNAAA